MKKLGIFLLIIAVGAGYAIWDQVRIPTPNGTMKISKGFENIIALDRSAPDIVLPTLQSGKITLAQFEGKTLLINFWATWCAPCVVEFPALVDLAKSRDDLVFIAISVDEDKAAIERFIAQQSIEGVGNIIIARDSDQNIAREVFGTLKFPESYIITPKGAMSHKVEGVIDWHEAAALKALGL
ncbi:MAG: TlpA family protein disulfide reductase [Micavibrio sp.]|nr:TlpA family protein disulfide reductase [Micavibrio sp.]